MVPENFAIILAIASLIFLAFGGLAGWLVGLLMKDSGFGLAGNMIAGAIGAVIGGLSSLLEIIPVDSLVVAAMVGAVAGAVILLFAIGLIKKAIGLIKKA